MDRKRFIDGILRLLRVLVRGLGRPRPKEGYGIRVKGSIGPFSGVVSRESKKLDLLLSTLDKAEINLIPYEMPVPDAPLRHTFTKEAP